MSVGALRTRYRGTATKLIELLDMLMKEKATRGDAGADRALLPRDIFP